MQCELFYYPTDQDTMVVLHLYRQATFLRTLYQVKKKNHAHTPQKPQFIERYHF